MLTLYVSVSIVIALTYLLISAGTLIFFRLPVHWPINMLLRVTGATFFLACGLHHIELAVHMVYDDATRDQTMTVHMLIFDLTQAVIAPVFAILCLLTLRHITVTIAVKPTTTALVAKEKSAHDR